jgi:hypothetical protein
VLLLLGFAVYRLGRRALEAWETRADWDWSHWLVLVVFALFMAVAEGYRGFQKKFSPRTAARIRYLRGHENTVHSLLAPLFCIGYIHANRRTKIIAYALIIGIATLVVLISLFLAQPWRGIIDAGVVIGLTWGMISLILFTVQALTREEFDVSPELPESS